MMVHHDARDYKVAASAAATHARGLMEKKIAEGRASAAHLIEVVNTKIPADYIARGNGLTFIADAEWTENDAEIAPGNNVRAPLAVELKSVNGAPLTIHNHALQQLCTKAGVPYAYLGELVKAKEPWARELAADILNKHYNEKRDTKSENLSTSKHLVRAVDGQMRGFLSDRYRRLDSRPLLDTFAAKCQEFGAIPVEGTCTDVRVALKAYLPYIFEPVENEVMMLGVEWSNSDYGSGKHGLRAILWRLWCTNLATMEDVLSQVHIGGRLSEDVEFSDRTYQLDTKAQVSALGDLVTNALAPKNTEALMATIKNANEQEIDWKNVSASLTKKLLKDELKAVRDAFDSDDVVNLPAQKTVWRMSNALSWLATKTEDGDRKLDLQRMAGEIITDRKAA
jgi:hypothetical protein